MGERSYAQVLEERRRKQREQVAAVRARHQAEKEAKAAEAVAQKKAEQTAAQAPKRTKRDSSRSRLKLTPEKKSVPKQTAQATLAPEKNPFDSGVEYQKPSITGVHRKFYTVQPYIWAGKKAVEFNYAEKVAYGQINPKLKNEQGYWDALAREVADPTHRHYNPYLSDTKGTNPSLEYFGVDKVDREWLKENAWLKNGAKLTADGNYSTSITKNMTPEQVAAAHYLKLEMAQAETEKAISQWSELRAELQDKFDTHRAIYGRNPSLEEYQSWIDIGKYSELANMDETLNLSAPSFEGYDKGTANVRWYNQPIGYGPEALVGYYSALRNGTAGEGVNYFEEAVNFYKQPLKKEQTRKNEEPTYAWETQLSDMDAAQKAELEHRIATTGTRREMEAFRNASYAGEHSGYFGGMTYDEAFFQKYDDVFGPVIESLREYDVNGHGQVQNPGSKATEMEKAAYEYHQIKEREEDTVQVEKEWAELCALIAKRVEAGPETAAYDLMDDEEGLIAEYLNDTVALKKYLNNPGNMPLNRVTYASQEALDRLVELASKGVDIRSGDVDYARVSAEEKASSGPEGITAEPVASSYEPGAWEADLRLFSEAGHRYLVEAGLATQEEVDAYRSSQVADEPAEHTGMAKGGFDSVLTEKEYEGYTDEQLLQIFWGLQDQLDSWTNSDAEINEKQYDAAVKELGNIRTVLTEHGVSLQRPVGEAYTESGETVDIYSNQQPVMEAAAAESAAVPEPQKEEAPAQEIAPSEPPMLPASLMGVAKEAGLLDEDDNAMVEQRALMDLGQEEATQWAGFLDDSVAYWENTLKMDPESYDIQIQNQIWDKEAEISDLQHDYEFGNITPDEYFISVDRLTDEIGDLEHTRDYMTSLYAAQERAQRFVTEDERPIFLRESFYKAEGASPGTMIALLLAGWPKVFDPQAELKIHDALNDLTTGDNPDALIDVCEELNAKTQEYIQGPLHEQFDRYIDTVFGEKTPDWARFLIKGTTIDIAALNNGAVQSVTSTANMVTSGIANCFMALRQFGHRRILGKDNYTLAEVRAIDPIADWLCTIDENVSAFGRGATPDITAAGYGASVFQAAGRTFVDAKTLGTLGKGLLSGFNKHIAEKAIPLLKNTPEALKKLGKYAGKVGKAYLQGAGYELRAYNDGVRTARELGYNEQDSAAYGLFSAATTGMLEGMVGNLYQSVSTLPFKGMDKVLQAVANKGNESLLKTIATSAGDLIKGLGAVIGNAMGEALEESTEVLLEDVGMKHVLHRDVDFSPYISALEDMVNGRFQLENYANTSVYDMWESGISGFGSSFITTILFGITSSDAGYSARSQRMAEKMAEGTPAYKRAVPQAMRYILAKNAEAGKTAEPQESADAKPQNRPEPSETPDNTKKTSAAVPEAEESTPIEKGAETQDYTEEKQVQTKAEAESAEDESLSTEGQAADDLGEEQAEPEKEEAENQLTPEAKEIVEYIQDGAEIIKERLAEEEAKLMVEEQLSAGMEGDVASPTSQESLNVQRLAMAVDEIKLKINENIQNIEIRKKIKNDVIMTALGLGQSTEQGTTKQTLFNLDQTIAAINGEVSDLKEKARPLEAEYKLAKDTWEKRRAEQRKRMEDEAKAERQKMFKDINTGSIFFLTPEQTQAAKAGAKAKAVDAYTEAVKGGDKRTSASDNTTAETLTDSLAPAMHGGWMDQDKDDDSWRGNSDRYDDTPVADVYHTDATQWVQIDERTYDDLLDLKREALAAEGKVDPKKLKDEYLFDSSELSSRWQDGDYDRVSKQTEGLEENDKFREIGRNDVYVVVQDTRTVPQRYKEAKEAYKNAVEEYNRLAGELKAQEKEAIAHNRAVKDEVTASKNIANFTAGLMKNIYNYFTDEKDHEAPKSKRSALSSDGGSLEAELEHILTPYSTPAKYVDMPDVRSILNKRKEKIQKMHDEIKRLKVLGNDTTVQRRNRIEELKGELRNLKNEDLQARLQRKSNENKLITSAVAYVSNLERISAQEGNAKDAQLAKDLRGILEAIGAVPVKKKGKGDPKSKTTTHMPNSGEYQSALWRLATKIDRHHMEETNLTELYRQERAAWEKTDEISKAIKDLEQELEQNKKVLDTLHYFENDSGGLYMVINLTTDSDHKDQAIELRTINRKEAIKFANRNPSKVGEYIPRKPNHLNYYVRENILWELMPRLANNMVLDGKLRPYSDYAESVKKEIDTLAKEQGLNESEKKAMLDKLAFGSKLSKNSRYRDINRDESHVLMCEAKYFPGITANINAGITDVETARACLQLLVFEQTRDRFPDRYRYGSSQYWDPKRMKKKTSASQTFNKTYRDYNKDEVYRREGEVKYGIRLEDGSLKYYTLGEPIVTKDENGKASYDRVYMSYEDIIKHADVIDVNAYIPAGTVAILTGKSAKELPANVEFYPVHFKLERNVNQLSNLGAIDGDIMLTEAPEAAVVNLYRRAVEAYRNAKADPETTTDQLRLLLKNVTMARINYLNNIEIPKHAARNDKLGQWLTVRATKEEELLEGVYAAYYDKSYGKITPSEELTDLMTKLADTIQTAILPENANPTIESQCLYDGYDVDVDDLIKTSEKALAVLHDGKVDPLSRTWQFGELFTQVGKLAYKIRQNIYKARAELGGGTLLAEYRRRRNAFEAQIVALQNDKNMDDKLKAQFIKAIRSNIRSVSSHIAELTRRGVTEDTPSKFDKPVEPQEKAPDVVPEEIPVQGEIEGKTALNTGETGQNTPSEEVTTGQSESAPAQPAQETEEQAEPADEAAPAEAEKKPVFSPLVDEIREKDGLSYSQARILEAMTNEPNLESMPEETPVKPIRAPKAPGAGSSSLEVKLHEADIRTNAKAYAAQAELDRTRSAIAINSPDDTTPLAEQETPDMSEVPVPEDDGAKKPYNPLDETQGDINNVYELNHAKWRMQILRSYSTWIEKSIDALKAKAKTEPLNAREQRKLDRLFGQRAAYKKARDEAKAKIESPEVSRMVAMHQRVDNAIKHGANAATDLSDKSLDEAMIHTDAWMKENKGAMRDGKLTVLTDDEILSWMAGGQTEEHLRENLITGNDISKQVHNKESILGVVEERIKESEKNMQDLSSQNKDITTVEAELYRLIDIKYRMKQQIENGRAAAKEYYIDSASSLNEIIDGSKGGKLPVSVMRKIIAMARDVSADKTNPMHLLSRNFANPKQYTESVFGKYAPIVNKVFFQPVLDANARIAARRQAFNDAIAKSGITMENEEIAHKYAEGKITTEELKKQRPEDFDAIIKGVQVFREMYDGLLDEINAALQRNGYDPVPKRENYFPHFSKDSSIMSVILGRDVDNYALNTELYGRTSEFRPGKMFAPHLLQRHGSDTEYGLLRGYESYIDAALQVVEQTNNIVRMRQFETELRNAFGLNTKDITRTRMSNYTRFLLDYANVLAGKKGALDNALESILTRRVYTLANAVKGTRGASLVVGNLSVALSNLIPIGQALSFAPAETAAAIVQMVGNVVQHQGDMFNGDDFEKGSAFLTRRFQGKRMNMDWFDTFQSSAQIPAEVIDRLTANILVRAVYFQGLNKNYNKATAMARADDIAYRMMASRVRGEGGLQQSTLVGGTVMQFAKEPINNLFYMIKDLPHMGSSTAYPVALAIMLLYNWLFNKGTGKTTALDPGGAVEKSVNAIDEDATLGSFVGDLAGNLWDTGWPVGETMPVVSGFQKTWAALGTFATWPDNYNEWEEVASGVLGWVPGGTQIERIYDAVKMTAKGYNESNMGYYRYAFDDANALDVLTAMTIGASSTRQGKEYTQSGGRPLGKNQDAAVKAMIAAGITPSAAEQNVLGTGTAKSLANDAKDAASYGDVTTQQQLGEQAAQERSKISIPDGMPSWAVADHDADYMQAAISLWQQYGDNDVLPKNLGDTLKDDGKWVDVKPEDRPGLERLYAERYRVAIRDLDPDASLNDIKKALKKAYNLTVKQYIDENYKGGV